MPSDIFSPGEVLFGIFQNPNFEAWPFTAFHSKRLVGDDIVYVSRADCERMRLDENNLYQSMIAAMANDFA